MRTVLVPVVLVGLSGCSLVDPARIDALFEDAASVDTSSADGGDGTAVDGTDGTDGSSADGTAADGTDGTDGSSTDGTDTGTPEPQPCPESWKSDQVLDLTRIDGELLNFQAEFSAPSSSMLAVAAAADGLEVSSGSFESAGPEFLYPMVVPAEKVVWFDVVGRRPAIEGQSTHTLLAVLEGCPRSPSCAVTDEESCIGAVAAGRWFLEETADPTEYRNESTEAVEVLFLVDQKLSDSMAYGTVRLGLRDL